jgi:hypothetical protein
MTQAQLASRQEADKSRSTTLRSVIEDDIVNVFHLQKKAQLSASVNMTPPLQSHTSDTDADHCQIFLLFLA